jgi:starvation-inducible DNA-binding protein
MPTNFAGGLKQNVRSQMVDLLNETLADTIALTLAVKQAHWNLKGRGFIGVHELLDEVADRLRGGADLMAERAVILGGHAHGTVETVGEKSRVEPYPTDAVKIADHIEALKSRFLAVGETVRNAIKAAGDAGDDDTADLFTEVSRALDKDAWFIGANAEDA